MSLDAIFLENQDNQGSWFSITSYLTAQVINFRNGNRDEEMILAETIGRRVVGELCFAGLLVASIIESALRAIISAVALLICCQELTGVIWVYGVLGAAWSIENSLNCLIALVKNVYEKNMTYDEVCPPLVDLNKDLLSPISPRP
jgi:hypothetical protein